MAQSGSKTLRIVAKDTRHLWPEILLTLALTFGFAATEHYGWPQTVGPREATTLMVWMNILMPVSWWLLIARAVHDESLVGALQFWVTRPYGWPRVLIAKLLLIAAFILLPFFLAQCFLLHQANLHTLPVLGLLLLKLLLLFAFVLLPLVALSTVTPSITRMFLLFLALVVYISLVGYFASAFGPAQPAWAPSVDSVFSWKLIAFAVPLVTAFVVILQYARRRATLSGSILIGLVLLLTAAIFASVYTPNSVHGYANLNPGAPAPLQLAFNPDPSEQTHTTIDAAIPPGNTNTSVMLSLPVTLSGIAPNHALQIDGYQTSYQPSGQPATKPLWERNSQYFTANAATRLGFSIPTDTFRASAGKAVTLQLTYAVTELAADATTTLPLNGTSLDVPQNGHCFWTPGAGDVITHVDCQFSDHRPSLTRITWNVTSTCPASPSASEPSEPAETWLADDQSPSISFSPVATAPHIAGSRLLGDSQSLFLCAGAPLTFTHYHVIGHHLVHVTLPAFDPQLYAVPFTSAEAIELEGAHRNRH
jgi:hypothetical protein